MRVGEAESIISMESSLSLSPSVRPCFVFASPPPHSFGLIPSLLPRERTEAECRSSPFLRGGEGGRRGRVEGFPPRSRSLLGFAPTDRPTDRPTPAAERPASLLLPLDSHPPRAVIFGGRSREGGEGRGRNWGKGGERKKRVRPGQTGGRKRVRRLDGRAEQEEEESPAASRFILLHSLLLRRLLFASAISILPDPSEKKKGSCCFPSNVVFPRDRTDRTGPGFSRGQFGSSPFFLASFPGGKRRMRNEPCIKHSLPPTLPLY